MRKNFGVKPFITPQPILIVATYDENGLPNALNAAWGVHTALNQIALSLDTRHKTTQNILAQKAFTVSMANTDNIAACDYVGIVSGNKVPDKFEKAGFHAEQSAFVNAPLIAELPLALECKLLRHDESTGMIIGEIMNVSIDESILGENGKVDMKKLRPVAIDPVNNDYIEVTEKVADAFKIGMTLMD